MDTIKFEVVHTFDGPATALLEKIANALAVAPAATPVALVKPRRKRRTAAEIAAEKDLGAEVKGAAELAADAEAQGRLDAKEAAKPKAEEKPTGPSIDDVRSKVRAHHKANGGEATKALFDGLSGESIHTIKGPDDLQTLSDRLDAVGVAALSGAAGKFD